MKTCYICCGQATNQVGILNPHSGQMYSTSYSCNNCLSLCSNWGFVDLGPINSTPAISTTGVCSINVVSPNVNTATQGLTNPMNVASNGIVTFGLACEHGFPYKGNCDKCNPMKIITDDFKCECGNNDKPKYTQQHSTWCQVYKREF
jgi:hypothetical protein